MGMHFFLQGLVHTQGPNLHLLHCRWILLHRITWDGCLYLILFYPCHVEAGFSSQVHLFFLVGALSMRASSLD